MNQSHKKIVHVVPAYPPSLGGMEQRVFELVTKLHDLQIPVEVYTSDLNTTLSGQSIEDGIPVYRFKKWSFLQTPISFKLVFKLLTVKADVFHVHLAQPFFPVITAFVATLRRKPYIVHIRAIVDSNNFFGRIFIYIYTNVALRFVFAFANKVIVLTNEYVGLLNTKYLVPKEKVMVIPNATAFSVNSTPRSLTPGQTLKLIAVGRVDKQKNYHFMLRAVLLLKQQGIDFTLSIVGTGRQEAELREYAESLGVAGNIVWKGRLEGLALEDEYNKADMFIHTAHFEGFATVLIEAMAKGLPICATKALGVNDVVKSGYNGFLCEKDERVFADTVISLYRNENKYNEISKNNLDTVVNFRWENILRDTIAVYNSLGF
jgi:glycosyltransferase involved in cell wall biosynthesis